MVKPSQMSRSQWQSDPKAGQTPKSGKTPETKLGESGKKNKASLEKKV